MFVTTALSILFYAVAFFGIIGLLIGKMPGNAQLSAKETRIMAIFVLIPLIIVYLFLPSDGATSTLNLFRAGGVVGAVVFGWIAKSVIKKQASWFPTEKCARCGVQVFPENVILSVGTRLIDEGHSDTAALAVMMLGFRCNKCHRIYCLDCLSKHGQNHYSGGKACLSCGGSISGLKPYHLR